MDAILKMTGITKRFPGVLALDNVDFDVRAGEVHGLAGENGAGKSTLMKVLGGIYRKDSGTVQLGSETLELTSPREGMVRGIVVVHQELQLCPNITVAENLFLGEGAELLGFRPFHRADLYRRAQTLLDELGLGIRADALIEELPIGQRQMVEIAKALRHDVRILILDEPTSSLSDADAQFLFAIVRKLKERGVGLVYISHRLKEIMAICDRVTVLRDGRKVTTLQSMDGVTPEQLVSLMVGRELVKADKAPRQPGEVQLEVKGLSRRGAFQNCSFSVRAGEIVGFAGLVGAGRTELMRAVIGADRADSGEILVSNQSVKVRSVADSLAHGIALVPEDRKRDGLMLEMSVAENLNLIAMRKLQRYTMVQVRRLRELAGQYVRKLGIKTPHLDQEIQFLSGGNQQKVVIAKWLTTKPKVLILDEPTRGIDVGAKHEIYEMMDQLAREGTAIIMVSSDLPEILANSDRVFVMAEGVITGELARETASEDAIMALCHLPHLGAVS